MTDTAVDLVVLGGGSAGYACAMRAAELGSSVVLIERGETAATCPVLVRVQELQSHHDRAKRGGAKILRAPQDYPFGERQYTAVDPEGHRWTFSQSIADVAPQDWGGTLGDLTRGSGALE